MSDPKLPKGQRPTRTVIRAANGNPLWEVKRHNDAVYVTDLTAHPMSDCCTVFEPKEVADAVARAMLGTRG